MIPGKAMAWISLAVLCLILGGVVWITWQAILSDMSHEWGFLGFIFWVIKVSIAATITILGFWLLIATYDALQLDVKASSLPARRKPESRPWVRSPAVGHTELGERGTQVAETRRVIGGTEQDGVENRVAETSRCFSEKELARTADQRAQRRMAEASQRFSEKDLVTLIQRLPDWPVRKSLTDAAEELNGLMKSLNIATRPEAEVPKEVTGKLAQEANETATILRARAKRIAAVAEHGISTPRLEEGLQREAERLEKLQKAIREAREGMVELTLAGGKPGEADRVESRFRALAQTARAFEDEELV